MTANVIETLIEAEIVTGTLTATVTVTTTCNEYQWQYIQNLEGTVTENLPVTIGGNWY